MLMRPKYLVYPSFTSRGKPVNVTRSLGAGEGLAIDFGCKTNGLAKVRLSDWFDAEMSFLDW